MSLRKALAELPDDLATRGVVRETVAYLQSHEGERFDAERVSRTTGIALQTTQTILCAMARAFVIDCDGDPRCSTCTFAPDAVLTLEIRRYLRGAGSSDARLHRGIDRFRGRYGPGA